MNMIQAIIDEQLTDKSSLSVILFSLARKHCYDFTEERVNKSSSLRQQLSKKVMNEAKEMAPHVTEEQWRDAAEYRAQKG